MMVQVTELLNDGFLDFGIGSEMATCRVLIQQSEELKISCCETPAVGRVFQCLCGGRAIWCTDGPYASATMVTMWKMYQCLFTFIYLFDFVNKSFISEDLLPYVLNHLRIYT
ncbi:hypothetical protein AVEN_83074-1 [Araneus ventricosus]|uniref:Uncharacterized protein n=1 Tax=Araneus ventricosus TaxID=182803 RepID=A0A4Y2AM64_ARAVE|nr:hypothetical protein AVEN_83074-1 [Araneus ventricosus]